MKTVGILLVLISCSGLGFQMAWRYGQRIEECVRIGRCLQRLTGEIRFHQLPLGEALRAAGGSASHDGERFPSLLRRVSVRLEDACGGSFENLWSQELGDYLQDSPLQEEAELLLYLGQQLGQLDLEEQLKVLYRFLDQWQEHIRSLKGRQEEKGRLYRYLGIFAGCFLAILLL